VGKISTNRGAAEPLLRGTIAAMAMSGLREATTSLDIVHRTPPESILERSAPGVFHRIPVERRAALVEFLHWTVGAGGGVLFGALPRRWRRQPWVRPLHGVLFWAAYEAVVASTLGLTRERWHDAAERLGLLADHVLYGMVVAASPWPYRD
jgi:hypothetical protein